MKIDGKWLKFVDGAFKGEYWIHTTLEIDWIRRRLPSGKWTYSGSARLVGADDKARKVVVKIERKEYKRHRLIALAKDGTAEGLAKFLDWKNNPVLHKKRRREDERPDDSPENVDFGTHVANNVDPNRKKRKPQASGHPVILTNSDTGETKPFGSALAAATFLGADPGHLRQYMTRTNGVKNMPKCALGGAWDAAYDEFELTDAVRLVRARAKLYTSQSHPNRLFRKMKTGKFCTTELERGEEGYVQIPVVGGGAEQLHVLVVETLRPGAFEAKLAANPGLTKADLDVHHVDYDERNNAIDNLEVLTKSEHRRKHAFEVEWLNGRGKPIWIFECSADVIASVRGKKGQPLNDGNVRQVCDGYRKHTGGQRFRWKDDALVKAKRAVKLAKRS
jgi:hypothetical protein